MTSISETSSTVAKPQSSLPPTSLIIASRNRPQLLKDTVDSILNGNELPKELVIIDQSDALHPILAELKTTRGCEIRYLRTQSVGLSRANNIGISAARYDLLIFTHDDVLVAPTWFEMIVKAALDAGPRGVVTGQVRPTTIQTSGGFVPSTKVDKTSAKYTGRLDKDVLYPLNMAIHRAAFTEVGNFDERLGPGTPFPGSEDSDLGFRLLEAGYCIYYIPEAVVYHRAWRMARDYLPLRWGYGCARGAFFAKHLDWHDRHMLRRMGQDIARLRYFPYRFFHQRREAFGDIMLVSGILFGAAKWLMTRSKTP
jgi:GT2 family glycosyltransferase